MGGLCPPCKPRTARFFFEKSAFALIFMALADKTAESRMNTSARMEQLEVLRIELEVFRQEHRDLDDAIKALEQTGTADMLTIRRLKKQKLVLKDKIANLEDRITPDIIA